MRASIFALALLFCGTASADGAMPSSSQESRVPEVGGGP